MQREKKLFFFVSFAIFQTHGEQKNWVKTLAIQHSSVALIRNLFRYLNSCLSIKTCVTHAYTYTHVYEKLTENRRKIKTNIFDEMPTIEKNTC